MTLFCRWLGIQIIFHLDNSVSMPHSKHLLTEHRDFVPSLLCYLGFLVNLAKSDLAPSQSYTFLGLQWDTPMGMVSLMDEKVKLQKDASNHLPEDRVLIWDMQKFLHLKTSTYEVHAYIHMPCKHLSDLYKHPNDRSSWCQLQAPAQDELISKPVVPPLPTTTITTDASRKGWGTTWGTRTASGQWKPGGSDHIYVLKL